MASKIAGFDNLADALAFNRGAGFTKKKKSQHDKRYYAQSHPGKRRRDKWINEHIDAILVDASVRNADRFIALEIGRSIAAIQAKRSKCKRLQEAGLPYYDFPTN